MKSIKILITNPNHKDNVLIEVQGFYAYGCGASIFLGCPYKYDSCDAESWKKGWMHAYSEDMNTKKIIG